MKTLEQFLQDNGHQPAYVLRNAPDGSGTMHIVVTPELEPTKEMKFIVQGNILIPETVSENGPPA